MVHLRFDAGDPPCSPGPLAYDCGPGRRPREDPGAKAVGPLSASTVAVTPTAGSSIARSFDSPSYHTLSPFVAFSVVTATGSDRQASHPGGKGVIAMVPLVRSILYKYIFWLTEKK